MNYWPPIIEAYIHEGPNVIHFPQGFVRVKICDLLGLCLAGWFETGGSVTAWFSHPCWVIQRQRWSSNCSVLPGIYRKVTLCIYCHLWLFFEYLFLFCGPSRVLYSIQKLYHLKFCYLSLWQNLCLVDIFCLILIFNFWDIIFKLLICWFSDWAWFWGWFFWNCQLPWQNSPPVLVSPWINQFRLWLSLWVVDVKWLKANSWSLSIKEVASLLI